MIDGSKRFTNGVTPMSRALVETDAALARVLGVARTAIVKAEQCGKITRQEDGDGTA